MTKAVKSNHLPLTDLYAQRSIEVAEHPLVIITKHYPRVARSSGWDDDAFMLRSAARVGSHEDRKQADRQLPRSICYHTVTLDRMLYREHEFAPGSHRCRPPVPLPSLVKYREYA